MQAVQENEPLAPIGRRLMLFPILIDKCFIELVGKARPRPLIVMAHYFALLVLLKSFWFIGNIGPREVRAIAWYVPRLWQQMIEWPLHVIENALPYSPTQTP